jgi:uncharacterized membrane protein YfhO
VLADAWYPGWRVTVDGNPAALHRTNLLFRGVELSPGRHVVIFAYEPRSWDVGRAISLVTLAALALVLLGTAVLSLRRRRI